MTIYNNKISFFNFRRFNRLIKSRSTTSSKSTTSSTQTQRSKTNFCSKSRQLFKWGSLDFTYLFLSVWYVESVQNWCFSSYLKFLNDFEWKPRTKALFLPLLSRKSHGNFHQKIKERFFGNLIFLEEISKRTLSVNQILIRLSLEE